MDIQPSEPQPAQKGWRVSTWAEATTLSQAYVHELIRTGKIRSVRAGKARVILTGPGEYLESLADNEAA
jgi:hypothetical protein